jgi:hypothetical protein
MKTFIIGKPLQEKCSKLEHTNNLIQVKDTIVYEEDSPEAEEEAEEEAPKKKSLTTKEALEQVVLPKLKELGIGALRELGKEFGVKNWWVLKKDKLIKGIKKNAGKRL